MEPSEPSEDRTSGMESWHQLPAEEDPSQFLAHTPALHEITCQHSVTVNHKGELSVTGDAQMQRVTDRFETLQLEFQDSRLSPALALIPEGKTLMLSESTLLHQTDSEFAPLRGFPDLSIASGGSAHMAHLDVDSMFSNTLHDQASLSQHPLGVIADISEGGSSCCSLSQHSLSPCSNFQVTQVHEEEQGSGPKNNSDKQMGVKEQTDVDVDKNVVSALSGGTLVHSFLDHLEKDVSVASRSAVSAASESALCQRQAVPMQPHLNQSEHTDLAHCQVPDNTSPEEPKSRLSGSREQPQGGSSSLSFQRKNTGNMGVSRSSLVSTNSNITVRSSSVQPTQTTDVTHRLLVSSSQNDATVSTSEHANQNGTKCNPNTQFATPDTAVGVPVPGLQRVIWASGSLTASDGSFLTSRPVSQSTPAVLLNRVAAATAMTKLFPIHSRPDSVYTMAISTQNSCSKASQMPTLDLGTTDLQTIPGVPSVTSGSVEAHTESGVPPLQPDVSDDQKAPSSGLHVSVLTAENTSHPPNSNALPTTVDREDQVSTLSAGKVRSLPTLSYLQKVDAWKANQSSSRLLYDNLALQEIENVPPKRKMLDSVFDGQSNMHAIHHNRTESEFGTNTSAQASQPGMDISSGPERGILRQGDQVTAGGTGAPSSASPLAHSHSHSSLSTVVTSIQLNGAQHNLQHPLATSDDMPPHLHESSRLSRRVAGQNPVDQLDTGPVKPSALIGLGQFTDVPSNPNIASALSSSQGSCQGEQSFLASVGAASSVVSLEVDNYAPYWTSRPGSPPRSFELNIEDRIPMYLHNLGIDQSPSTILNPFTPRGPIREPEFSPTDLCTIKDSVGTPAKSTQTSEGESPQKETFSSSSLFSVDSCASITRRLAVQRPDRPPSRGSVRMVRCHVETAHDSHTLSHQNSAPQDSGNPQREGSYGLPAQLSLESVPHPGDWPEDTEADSSLVGSGTLQEIRRLLGCAESLVSGHSSLMSSPGSHCYSESNTSFLSLRRNTQAYLDDSSLSVGGKISPGLARTSSDSVLKESSSSSYGPLELSTQIDHITTDTVTHSQSGEENLKSHDLRVAPRRTEPEGCSAADPDKVGPVGLPAQQGSASSASDDNQQSQESTVNAGICSPENSPTHSLQEADLGVLSDGSSESSLAARVAKLLQSESPVSVVTSRPSTTDPEESRAREWIMMKVSGRQCEALELNVEDRKRIEEIKRELLLHTKHLKWSSDSEGSSQSGISAVPKPRVGFAAVRNAEDHLSELLQRAAQDPLHSTSSLHISFDHIPESRVHQIALRDRLSPTAPLTSITIATTRRTPSPQLLTQTALEGQTNTAPQHEHRGTPTHSVRKSTDEEIKQTFVSDREIDIEKKGTVKESKEGNSADEQENDKESEKMDVVQEVAHKNLTGKEDIPPNLDSGLVPAHKSHISQFHLTLSPKPEQSATQRLHSPTSEARTVSELQLDSHTHYSDRLPSQSTQRGIPPSVSSSSEEKPASVMSKTSAGENRRAGQHLKLVSGFSQISTKYPQTFTPRQRFSASARPLSVQTAAVPTLLPYKPHGSAELFYMPQTDPEVSPAHSITTMESSHTGSDDALPPHFTTEVLGSRELEDKNVTPKHKEGIYTKRAKMNRESTVRRTRLYSKVAHSTQKDKAGSPYQLSIPSASSLPARGQGIVHSVEQDEEEEEEFVPLHMEADHSTNYHQSHTVPEMLPSSINPIRDREQSLKTQELNLAINSSLDHLWRRFSERYSLHETQPTNEAETSLLERLERLSRLLHSTTPPHTPAKQARSQDERGKIRRRELEVRRAQGKETSRKGGDKEKSEVRVTRKIAWEEHTLKTDQTLEEEQENTNRCPAERDESASISVETSSSQSTIDTQRLLRAFGPHRVNSGSTEVTRSQTSKTSPNLLKLYNTINRQKGGHEASISDQRESEVISTDESTASAGSSSSTYTLPSQRATARTLTTKRPKAKLVNRGVQAGDLEIVVNGTRRHTRDVGTTFPSPSNTRNYRTSSSGNMELQTSIPTSRSSSASPAQSQTLLRKEALHKSSQTHYPDGVSWFVTADELKQDARKENEPQPEAMPAASKAWFEPYTRSQPWKEPLREPLRERHLQPERKKPSEPKAQAETDSSKPSVLVRLSLQEALELHRPEFMSRSRERMKRLCLLAEERKMQAIFNREREELFNRPLPVKQPTAAPPPMPSKRVIPMKEMVQRSKRIYAQLPEVQKRKLEEKRKAEYRTYRLNAQHFNKKVTNHVLGRRAPWQ